MSLRGQSNRARPAGHVNRLYGLYHTATAAELVAGRAWYEDGRRFVCGLAERYSVSHETAAAVVAALSPNSTWERNQRDSETVLHYANLVTSFELGESDAYHAFKVATYHRNKAKAWAIATGEPIAEHLRGPKVTVFARNLLGSRDELTLDSHAFNAWYGWRAIGSDLACPPAAHRRLAERDYRRAAARLGEHVSDFQAIIWVRWKRAIAAGRVSGYQRNGR